MRVILGIDAAWTEKHSSGLALVAMHTTGLRLVCVAPSYERFLAFAAFPSGKTERPLGAVSDPAALLAAAAVLCGQELDLVAVDMPLAHSTIRRRRHSDNAVSSAYGSRKCGTHSPGPFRPGVIRDTFRQGFADAGYPLQTKIIAAPCLIEVYPHPALVELARASERLPYKFSKIRSYWPSATPPERRRRVVQKWAEITALLEQRIAGVTAALPKPEPHANGTEMKAFEDQLDAIVCAWVGACALDNNATPYADEDSAIWIPTVNV